jgi:hypothetical protein
MFHIASSKGPPIIPENLSADCKDFLYLCFNRRAKLTPPSVLATVCKASCGPPCWHTLLYMASMPAHTGASGLVQWKFGMFGARRQGGTWP